MTQPQLHLSGARCNVRHVSDLTHAHNQRWSWFCQALAMAVLSFFAGAALVGLSLI